jgi:hypothetical protein
MFDRRDDPKHLLDSLRRFMRWWDRGERPWYGIAQEKLNSISLPTPLRDLYSFAGDWPGNNFFVSAFGYRNHLVAFEFLTEVRGKLAFGFVSEGGPIFGTEFSGNDPPVWTSQSDKPWEKVCDSLAQFVVTFCLHEMVFGGLHKARPGDLLGFAKSANLHVSPVWLEGPYVGAPENVYLVDADLLVLGYSGTQWGSTQSDAFAERFPDLFPKEQAGRKTTLDAVIRDPSVPLLVRESVARRAMREQKEQAEYHAAKAAAYEQVLSALKGTSPQLRDELN